MIDDIVCLLQDLGKGASIDVIANFLIRNPDTEDLIAAKMGSLLSTSQPSSSNTSSETSSNATVTNQDILSRASSLIPNALSLAFTGLGNSSHKMVFVVNMDLNMGRGKQCAQVAHAALGLYLQIQQSGDDEVQFKVYQWLSMGQKKIVLKGNGLNQMMTIQDEAERAKLPNFIVSDAGCTQIAPGSKTVLAIFGQNEELDKITGSLKLL